MQAIDLIALWAIWWCSAAGLAAGHEVRTWRSLARSGSLLVIMVSAFIGAVTVWVQPYLLAWWMRGLIWGCAVLGAWLYDERFGIRLHLLMLRRWVRSLPDKWRQLRDRARQLQRRHP